MKKINLWLVMLGLILINCKHKEEISNETSFTKPGNAPYIIKEVHPSSAIPGTTITISGTNFPEKGLEVYFNDVWVDSLESVSALSVSVNVPRLKAPGKVRLQLRSRGTEAYSNTIPFSVEPIPNDLPKLYFTTHKLYSGSINGKGLLEIDELLEIGFPRGLEVDKLNNELIFASYYGQVYRKVGDAEPVLIKKFPEGLECMILDSKKEWIYISSESTISRMSLKDTTRIEVLYKERQHPKSLHLNERENQILWTEQDPLYVVKGSIDGKEKPTVIFNMESGLTGPTCLEIDEENQKIYVGDVSSFGNSRIMEGDLRDPGKLKILYTTKEGIGENVLHLEYDKLRYLYVMNSKGVNKDVFEDGGIVRMSVKDKELKPEVVLQPIHHGYLIAL